MAITTSKPEIFSPSANDISWRSLQSSIEGQSTQNIRFGGYKRIVSPDEENPIVPDAEENSQIGTEESGNLSIGAFRGAIKRHDITIGTGEYQNLEFQKYFGNNLIKNIIKNVSVAGTVYSDDVSLPAAEVNSNQQDINNLTIEVTSSGSIYGAGAPGTTGTQGISGGTALYVQASNARNFTIDIDSGGKVYGGGGGGILGSPGSSNTFNSCSQTNSITVPGNTTTNTHNIPGNPGPTNNESYILGNNFSQARAWDERAENYCRRQYPSGDAFGGGATQLRDTPDRSTCNAGCGPGWPNQVAGTYTFKCSTKNPPTTQTRTRTNPPTTTNTTIYDSITSSGGPGGSGGPGQGYGRSFALGSDGSAGPTVDCRSLGSGWGGGSTTGNPGTKGTSGGNWGEPGASDNGGITGGAAGFAIKTSGIISYEVIGADDDRLKGQISPTI